jgi:hypothetical protein
MLAHMKPWTSHCKSLTHSSLHVWLNVPSFFSFVTYIEKWLYSLLDEVPCADPITDVILYYHYQPAHHSSTVSTIELLCIITQTPTLHWVMQGSIDWPSVQFHYMFITYLCHYYSATLCWMMQGGSIYIYIYTDISVLQCRFVPFDARRLNLHLPIHWYISITVPLCAIWHKAAHFIPTYMLIYH